jgi:hypothetical protein
LTGGKFFRLKKLIKPLNERLIMKNKPLILAAFGVTALVLAGCQQSNTTKDNPAVNDTNSLSVTQQLQNAREAVTNALEKTKQVTTNAWANLKDSAQSAVDYTYDKKDAFVANANAELAALDQKTKELTDKAATASDSIKTDVQTKLQELSEKRAVLDKKFDAVKNATEANWNDVKTRFQSAYDDTKESVKQAWQWLADKLNS